MFKKLRGLLGGSEPASPASAEASGPSVSAVPAITLNEVDLDDGDLPPDDPDRSLDASIHYLDALTNAHSQLWHMDRSSWAADLETGIITFTNHLGWVITAPVQVVGTLNTANGSWLWGWDHPSVPAPVAQHAQLVHDFGVAHDLEAFTVRMIDASEEDAWQFAALAAYLTKAQGAYRGPAGDTMIFMTFGELTITKP